ncbi:Small nuclear ribonucleoprotein-associated protein B [Diplonema papillatum]|nr:Small nuclear ribonucleoprotein-associated protein B [Diplonema papillatum]WGM49929.1 SmB [Diplonema papillatum]
MSTKGNRRSKLYSYMGSTLKVTINDGRVMKGTLLAYDRYLNLILTDTEESRFIPDKNSKTREREEKRTIGLMLLRGESVTSMTIEGTLNKAAAAKPAPASMLGGRPPFPFPPGMMPPGMMPPGMMPPGMLPPGMPPGMMPPGAPPGRPPPGFPALTGPPGQMPAGFPPPGMGFPPPPHGGGFPPHGGR